MTDLSLWRIYCTTSNKFEFLWATSAISSCPVSGEHGVNSSSVNKIVSINYYKTITYTDSPFSLTKEFNYFLCDSTSGNISFLLTTDQTINSDRIIVVQKDVTSNTLTITPESNKTIDGNSSLVITTKSFVILQSNSSGNWTSILVNKLNIVDYLKMDVYLPASSVNISGTSKYGVVVTAGSNNDLTYNSLWTDMTVPLYAAQSIPGDISPPFAPFIGNIQMPVYQGALTSTSLMQSLQVSLQFSHGWDKGTAVNPHIHLATGKTVGPNSFMYLTITSSYPGAGTYYYDTLYAIGGAYLTNSVTPVTTYAAINNNYYAVYYCAVANDGLAYTLIYQTTGQSGNGSYVLARGDWRKRYTSMSLPDPIVLTNNTGTLATTLIPGGTLPTGAPSNVYVPTHNATYGNYVLGSYISSTPTQNPYSSINLTINSVVYTFVLTSGGAYIDSTQNTVEANYNGNKYDAYYSLSADKTLIYYQTDSSFVVANGNWCYTGRPANYTTAHGSIFTITSLNDAGTTASSTSYRPNPSRTYNSITVGAYTSGYTARFIFEYCWANIGNPPGTHSSLTTFDTAYTIVSGFMVNSNQYEHMMCQFTPIPGTSKALSSIIVGKISRTPGNSADTYLGDLFGLSFDLHVLMSSIGYGPTPGSGAV